MHDPLNQILITPPLHLRVDHVNANQRLTQRRVTFSERRFSAVWSMFACVNIYYMPSTQFKWLINNTPLLRTIKLRSPCLPFKKGLGHGFRCYRGKDGLNSPWRAVFGLRLYSSDEDGKVVLLSKG